MICLGLIVGLIICCASVCIGLVTTNVCNLEKKTIACNNDSVVYIDSARYGRMRVGSCLNADYGYINCSADVRSYLERKCSGRRSCLLEYDPVLDRSNHRCPSDLRTYLEASHHCTRVETPPRNFDSSKCDGNRYPVGMATPNGYLARIVTMETRIGSSTCPWSIEARSGQTIRLTLYDFGLWQDPTATSSPGPGDSYGGRPMCQVYATISERTGTAGARTLCGGAQVLQHAVDGGRMVYTSSSNSVQLAVTTTNNPMLEQFLLKYEVVGCADPDPRPPLAHVERSFDRLLVKCTKDNSDRDPEAKIWTIQCLDDGNWSMPLSQIDCSTSAGVYNSSRIAGNASVFNAIYLVAGIGVAVLVGIASPLVAFILYLRCRKKKSEARRTSAQTEPLPSEYDLMPYAITYGHDAIEDVVEAKGIHSPRRLGYTPSPDFSGLTSAESQPPGVCLRMDHKKSAENKKVISVGMRSTQTQTDQRLICQSCQERMIRPETNGYNYIAAEGEDYLEVRDEFSRSNAIETIQREHAGKSQTQLIGSTTYLDLISEEDTEISEDIEDISLPSDYLQVRGKSLSSRPTCNSTDTVCESIQNENSARKPMGLFDSNDHAKCVTCTEREIAEGSDEIPSDYLHMTENSLQSILNNNVYETVQREESHRDAILESSNYTKLVKKGDANIAGDDEDEIPSDYLTPF